MNKVRLFDLVGAVSDALDLVSPAVVGHHKRVAAIASELAGLLGLDAEEQSTLLTAGLLHDAGAFTLQNRLDALVFETEDQSHGERGYRLLSLMDLLAPAASLVRHHHARWADRAGLVADEKTFLLSNLVNIADRADVLLKPDRDAGQIDEVARRLKRLSGSTFAPVLADAFAELAADRDFWNSLIKGNGVCERRTGTVDPWLDMDAMHSFSTMVSHLIDFRSRFTATHSRGVSATAGHLARLSGLTESAEAMEVAGNLHDLGKLAVPTEIIEKPGPLSPDEFAAIQGHADVTRKVLGGIEGLEDIGEWSARHHERLDGSGYPDGCCDLSYECRILGVADVFTALSEDRPYRQGMDRSEAMAVLEQMARAGQLDKDVVFLVKSEYESVNAARLESQRKALAQFQRFHN